MYSLALKTDDKSIITGMLYCIYIFIILESYIPDLTTVRISDALSNLFFFADQRTLSISLSGVLLACSLGQYLLSFFCVSLISREGVILCIVIISIIQVCHGQGY